MQIQLIMTYHKSDFWIITNSIYTKGPHRYNFKQRNTTLSCMNLLVTFSLIQNRRKFLLECGALPSLYIFGMRRETKENLQKQRGERGVGFMFKICRVLLRLQINNNGRPRSFYLEPCSSCS